jgi:magnesium-transporting ATPase (P-type)
MKNYQKIKNCSDFDKLLKIKYIFNLLNNNFLNQNLKTMVTLFFILYLAFIVFIVASIWKTFVKAGHPGWAAIVPFYNLYIMTLIAKKPGWWIVLFFIPLVNVVIMILLSIEIAKNFGKGSGFGIGLALLGFIFWPILGFGDAVYEGTEISETDHLIS